MTIYLVDYENTNASGMLGLSDKTQDDTIIIFYSEKVDKLSFSLHLELQTSKATVEYILINGSGKNCLDFQLSTYLGYLIQNNEKASFVIVSKDTGFIGVVDFWKSKGIDVSMLNNLIEKNKNIATTCRPITKISTKPLSISKLDDALEEFIDEKDTILSIIDSNHAKLTINNELVKAYGTQKAGVIYRVIKPFLIMNR